MPLTPERVWQRRWRLLVVNAGGTGMLGVYDTAWSVYLHHLGATRRVMGFLWTLLSLPRLFMSLAASRVADRAHWRRTAVGGGVLAIVLLAGGCGVVPTVWAAMALPLEESSVMAMIGPSVHAWRMEGGAAADRGAVQGGVQAAGTLGPLALALSTGYVLALSVRWLFFMGAPVLAGTGLTLWAERPRRPAGAVA